MTFSVEVDVNTVPVWDEPPLAFSDKGAATEYARSLCTSLVDQFPDVVVIVTDNTGQDLPVVIDSGFVRTYNWLFEGQ